MFLSGRNAVEIQHLIVFFLSLSGSDQNVTIKPYGSSSTQRALGSSKNFTFICSSSASDAAFELHILGPGNETKLAKVSQNETALGTIFTYNITNYTDDQTTFRCQFESWMSPNLTLTVFCECLTVGMYHWVYSKQAFNTILEYC